jgi:hypothetical protein
MEKQVGQRIEFWHRLYDRTWGITWRYEIGTDRIIADYTGRQEFRFLGRISGKAHQGCRCRIRRLAEVGCVSGAATRSNQLRFLNGGACTRERTPNCCMTNLRDLVKRGVKFEVLFKLQKMGMHLRSFLESLLDV